MASDPYRTLGVSRDADQATIRRAFQRLARRLHPALHPDDPEVEARFRAVERAYAVLCEPSLPVGIEGGRAEAGEVHRAVLRRRIVISPRRAAIRLEELAVDLIRMDESGGPPPGPRGELDIEAEVSLEFAEAVRGATTSLSVERETDCGRCRGRGESEGESCPECAGNGRLVGSCQLRIRTPAGLDDGSRLRLRGQGYEDPSGGGPGDLYVTVRVRPHPYFRRREADILTVVPVTVAEAMLGGEIDVPTVDGPLRVRVPPGTSGGQMFRVRGRGLTRPGGGRGDHFYTLRVVVPSDPDRATRKLVSRLEQEDPRGDLPFEGI